MRLPGREPQLTTMLAVSVAFKIDYCSTPKPKMGISIVEVGSILMNNYPVTSTRMRMGCIGLRTLPRRTFSPTRTVEWRGVHPGSNRQWRYSLDVLERLYSEDRILLRRDGLPRKDGLKSYLKEAPGAVFQDVWTDIELGPTSGERTGYPTQKPLELLERIVSASSNPGDVVLDPFCGCATACVAAGEAGGGGGWG